MFTDFTTFFRALWDRDPFPWQTMLAKRAADGHWPYCIDLPTAAGKTACLDIAVYALAAQAGKPLAQRTAPRRIWFVVDRRIVVDEAYERANTLANKLAEKDAAPAIRAVAERLLEVRGLRSQERPLAVGRLRGGVLRDDCWARIPSQAAIITSTVDQLGSRLLFRSYGDSPLAAPIYAGLAGNDSLILLDEAHCARPFLRTLQAVQTFRSPKWSGVENPTPFHVTILSATPPSGGDEDKLQVFPDESERKRALDHETLQLRLRASKKAVLEKVRDEEKLTQRIAEAAAAFARGGKHRVGVIVNRVGRAADIARMLEEKAPKAAPDGEPPAFDVRLLTGRIRPVERDLLVGKDAWLHRVLRSCEPEQPSRPLILVATQCLEVGADFSFDALVTECASLDALRQRFGRLDRLGTHGESPAVILTADSLLEEADPIYDEALRNTWEFLWEPPPKGIAVIESVGARRERRTVDFGVNALSPLLPTCEALLSLLAPAPDSPILLPAHLDLLCQTSPQPHPNPDLGAFLHGKGRGVPEVRVVWRCDLASLRPPRWAEVVSLCRPVTGEMLSVPLYRFQRWLGGRAGKDLTGDVEGEAPEEQETYSAGPQFLIWRGRDRSEVLADPDRIPPGSIIVLPVPPKPAEAELLGQTLRQQGFGHDQLDLWELAWQCTGRPPVLRLNRACLGRWEACPPIGKLLALVEEGEWDIAELREGLAAVADWVPEDETAARLPDWLRKIFTEVKDIQFRDVAAHPGGGLTLRAQAERKPDMEPDFFADDDDARSEEPDAVGLSQHTEQVERNASQLADACLGEAARSLFETAARWHDVGKLDPRFQTLLYGGIPNPTRPLAKSPGLPRSRELARAVRESANLPDNFRHEMLSLCFAERHALAGLSPGDQDLVLHLIASHHGHARPFAPLCEDSEPCPVGGHAAGSPVALSAEDRRALTPPHRLDSGVSERFWTLTRRFGWWGLAYREAILRLADWYASAHAHKAEKES